MRIISLAASFLLLASCGGPSIENSGDAARDQVNAIGANISEGSGRNEAAETLGPVPGQRGLAPQEPPRGGN